MSTSLSSVAAFTCGMALALLAFHAANRASQYQVYSSAQVDIPMTNFDGFQWTTNHTMAAVTLASCKYGQFQSHTVKTESGEIAKDWLWTNDRDQVNILVQIGDGDMFMVSREHRYGLHAESYSAPNGYVRLGENPTTAALRVLRLDYGIIPGDLQTTGSYRIQVNRGGGFLHTFIARNSTAIAVHPDMVAPAAPKKKIILSKRKIIDMLLSGKLILEAQWAGALAIGVLMV
jgi:hypothetical protein